VDKALRSLVDWYARVGVDVPDLAPIVPVRKAKTERRLPTAKQEKVSVSQKPSPNEDAPRPLSTDVAAKCKTLDELRAAMQSFDAGFLSDGARQAVFSRGNPEADLMVIGEAPGRDEDIQGNPKSFYS